MKDFSDFGFYYSDLYGFANWNIRNLADRPISQWKLLNCRLMRLLQRINMTPYIVEDRFKGTIPVDNKNLFLVLQLFKCFKIF